MRPSLELEEVAAYERVRQSGVVALFDCPILAMPGSRLSVSTVVPTFNRAALLDMALRSAVSQCLPGDEIIVVDDGSTDDTPAVVRSFGPSVRYLQTAHLGAGAARNVGVRAASCDLVAFLDSDDEWLPDKIAVQRAVMERFPEILYVFSDFGFITHWGERYPDGIRIWSTGSLRPCEYAVGDPVVSSDIPGVPATAPPFGLRLVRLYEMYLWSWCVFTSTVMVRRESAGDALRFAEDTPTYEDVECFARLARHGVAGFVDCELALQRQHPGPRLTDSDVVTNAETALKILDRVYGTDKGYLETHRGEFEAAMDAHHDRKFRYLLRTGERAKARQELDRFFRAPKGRRLLTYVPTSLLKLTLASRRRARLLLAGRVNGAQ